MNKYSTIFTLIQNCLSEAELQSILAEFSYVDSARKCTVSTLISSLIEAATWAIYHGERSGIKLHVSFTNETAMPLQVVETKGLKHDGPVGGNLEDARFILVCYRAYFSIEKVDRYLQEKQHFFCV